MTLSDSGRKYVQRLFSDEIAADDAAYLESCAFEPRRTLLRNDVLGQLHVSRPFTYGASEYDPDGPYEQTIFNEIVSLAKHVCILQGGTGSGKSTLAARLAKRANRIHRERLRNSGFPAISSLSVVDLQDAAAQFDDKSDSQSYTDSDKAKVLDRIAHSLDADLKRLCSNDTSTILSIYDDLLRNGLPSDNAPALTSTVHSTLLSLRKAIATVSSSEQWKDRESPERYDLLTKALSTVDDPAERLRIRLLPYCQLSRQLPERLHAQFVLLLDNLDRIPAALQHALYSAIHMLFRNRQLESCPIRIVLAMRLSSAVDPKAAFGEFEVLPHSAPDPAEVVFYRLTCFLWSVRRITNPSSANPPPKRFSFDRFDSEEQTELLARLYLLWEHLRNKDGPFFRMLSALAGTNSRIAFNYAQEWASNDELFSRKKTFFNVTGGSISSNVNKFINEHVCTSFGLAIAQGIRSAFFSGRTLSAGSIKAMDSNDSAKTVCSIILEVLDDCGFMIRSKKKSPRRYAGTMASNSLDLKMQLNDVEDHPYVFSRIQFLRDWCESLDPQERDAVLQHARATLIECKRIYRAKTTEYTKEKQITSHPVVLKKIAGILEVAEFSLNLEDEDQRVDYVNRITAGPRAPQFLDGLSIDAGRNFFEMCRFLLETDGKRTHRPINVFSLDGVSANAAILRILTLIYDTSHRRGSDNRDTAPMSPQRLIFDAAEHGYSDLLVPAINAMVDVNNRLIYSGVFDSLDGAEEILGRESATLRLSWAGHEYLRYLSRNPIYLQWALSLADLPGSSDEWFAERRFDAVCESFRILITKELEVLNKRHAAMTFPTDEQRRRFFTATEPLVQGCVADVFFRSMENFLYDVFRSYKRQVDRASKSIVPEAVVPAHVTLFHDWISTGEWAIHRYAQLFEKENASWRRTIDACSDLVFNSFGIPKVQTRAGHN